MRTYVLHPARRGGAAPAPEHALAEAVSLADALDLDVRGAEIVPVPRMRAGTLFGSGKVEEIAEKIAAEEVGLVVVDGALSPVQQRNLERAWNAKVLDRTGLILEIFGERAQTREGVLQVELAHLDYQKSRLVRSWTHLERQRGGVGFLGGPGETQIEADRRALNERIVRIRRALEKVVKTRGQHRAARKRVPYPVVALVGYTNAGKSTLFNRLTGATVLAKDMLFATLDPTMRAIDLPGGQRVILADTVGFISDLPTQLVAAFRATLEEVLDADLILHVRDIAHPESPAQAENVLEILSSLGVSDAAQGRIVEVWNKVDTLGQEEARTLSQIATRTPRVHAISALSGEGIEDLLLTVDCELKAPQETETLCLGFAESRQRAWLFDNNVVTSEEQVEGGYRLAVSWTARERARFHALGAVKGAV